MGAERKGGRERSGGEEENTIFYIMFSLTASGFPFVEHEQKPFQRNSACWHLRELHGDDEVALRKNVSNFPRGWRRGVGGHGGLQSIQSILFWNSLPFTPSPYICLCHSCLLLHIHIHAAYLLNMMFICSVWVMYQIKSNCINHMLRMQQ